MNTHVIRDLSWCSLMAVLASPLLMAQAQTPAGFGLRSGGLEARVETSAGHLQGLHFHIAGTLEELPFQELFHIRMQDGREVAASTLAMVALPTTETIAAEPGASRAAAHLPGRSLCAHLHGTSPVMELRWCLIARGEEPYLRQEVTIKAGREPLPIAHIEVVRIRDTKAHVVGDVAGSPIVHGDLFLGVEDPLSSSEIKNGTITAGVERSLPLAAGQSIEIDSVVGVARPGQLRRDFLNYLELERAHPYRTFLHYNTWYDLGAGNRFSADDVLNRMNAFGTELVQKRGVTMDSFLMDDGWDNPRSMWQFDQGFPNGFAPLRSTAAKYGFGIGVWMSPWGGYDEEKKLRVAYGTSHGYEMIAGGYALSGPRYYGRFEQTCLAFISDAGVNQFKLDGTGNANQVFPGSIFDSDFVAAIHLIRRMREASPSVFINVTTGTKPSPFWLRYADSIWRSGEDHDFAGEGSWRQRWITYRDGQTYANIVRRGPLFPLNSLMLHGIIYAEKAEHLNDDPQHDFSAEVHSFFGSGTQLQEMYVTPSLLSPADWDVLAESARWARQNAATLRDTHWIGGDPLQGAVYGWASWSREKGILVLRNPSARPEEIAIDAGSTFELPADAAKTYTLQSPWNADQAQSAIALQAGSPHQFTLKPFEVLTLEAHPTR